MTEICGCSPINRYTQGRLGHPPLCVECKKITQTYEDFFKEQPAIYDYNSEVNEIFLENFYLEERLITIKLKLSRIKSIMKIFIITTIILLITNIYAYSCPAYDWTIEENKEEREWREFKEFLELIDCEDRQN